MSTPRRQLRAPSRRPWGVLAPVLTPFDTSGNVDLPAFVEHCRWLVSQGVGLVLFTAESETAHLSLAERQALLNAVLSAGIAADRVMAQVRGAWRTRSRSRVSPWVPV
jgi:4-hydroxy-tetrahydrodipicolinate synthase